MPATKIFAGVGGGDDVCADAGRQRGVCVYRSYCRFGNRDKCNSVLDCLLALVRRLKQLGRSLGGCTARWAVDEHRSVESPARERPEQKLK